MTCVGSNIVEIRVCAAEGNPAEVALEELALDAAMSAQSANALGLYHSRKGDHVESIRWFSLEVANSPDRASGYYNLSVAFAKVGRARVSEHYLMTAVRRQGFPCLAIEEDPDLQTAVQRSQLTVDGCRLRQAVMQAGLGWALW